MASVIWSWNFNANRPAPPQPQPLAPTPPIPDEFWQRILKAVPVTAVSFVTGATTFALAGSGTLQTVLLGVVFGLGPIFAFAEMIVLRKAGRLEVGIAIAAYLVWTYAQGGIFESLHWHQPLVAGIVAIAFAVALL